MWVYCALASKHLNQFPFTIARILGMTILDQLNNRSLVLDRRIYNSDEKGALRKLRVSSSIIEGQADSFSSLLKTIRGERVIH